MATARKKLIAPDPWMTLNQAAKELGESRLAVLTRTVKGEIDAKHEAGRTIVSRESVRRVKAGR